MESPDSKVAGLYDTTCLLGYGMLPLLAHALACLLVPRYACLGDWAAALSAAVSVQSPPQALTSRSLSVFPTCLNISGVGRAAFLALRRHALLR